MSDLFGNHIVGFPTRRLKVLVRDCQTVELQTQVVVKSNEPVHEKPNNLGSDQVSHKPGCTVTEEG